jgi:hypothetical protein
VGEWLPFGWQALAQCCSCRCRVLGSGVLVAVFVGAFYNLTTADLDPLAVGLSVKLCLLLLNISTKYGFELL